MHHAHGLKCIDKEDSKNITQRFFTPGYVHDLFACVFTTQQSQQKKCIKFSVLKSHEG